MREHLRRSGRSGLGSGPDRSLGVKLCGMNGGVVKCELRANWRPRVEEALLVFLLSTFSPLSAVLSVQGHLYTTHAFLLPFAITTRKGKGTRTFNLSSNFILPCIRLHPRQFPNIYLTLSALLYNRLLFLELHILLQCGLTTVATLP